jgi:translation initiation factor IF-3
LYNEEKKHKAQHKAHRIEIKEVRIRPNIEDHDFLTKKRQIEKFILHGDKVKVSLSFKGREITKPELGMRVMQRLCTELEPVVELVSGPTKDGKSIIAIMVAKVHKK